MGTWSRMVLRTTRAAVTPLTGTASVPQHFHIQAMLWLFPSITHSMMPPRGGQYHHPYVTGGETETQNGKATKISWQATSR